MIQDGAASAAVAAEDELDVVAVVGSWEQEL